MGISTVTRGKVLGQNKITCLEHLTWGLLRHGGCIMSVNSFPCSPSSEPHFVIKIITCVLQGCLGTEEERASINCKELARGYKEDRPTYVSCG